MQRVVQTLFVTLFYPSGHHMVLRWAHVPRQVPQSQEDWGLLFWVLRKADSPNCWTDMRCHKCGASLMFCAELRTKPVLKKQSQETDPSNIIWALNQAILREELTLDLSVYIKQYICFFFFFNKFPFSIKLIHQWQKMKSCQNWHFSTQKVLLERPSLPKLLCFSFKFILK